MIQTLLLNLLQPLATLASGIGKRKKLLIMIYHRVLDEPDYMRPGEVDKETFTWQMQLVAKHFNVLPLAEALERLQNDNLPPRAVCITFDDGYADNYTNALPILQKFNLTATFFIASGFLDGGRMWNDTVIEAVRNIDSPILDLNQQGLGIFETSCKVQKYQAASQIIQIIKHLEFAERTRVVKIIEYKSQSLPSNLMMTRQQVINLNSYGMEIGGHTVNHPILEKLEYSTAKKEILENKVFLEELLGRRLDYFAYPNGKPGADFSENHASLVRELKYCAAVSTEIGVASRNNDLFSLPRFTPWDKCMVWFAVRMVYVFLMSRYL